MITNKYTIPLFGKIVVPYGFGFRGNYTYDDGRMVTSPEASKGNLVDPEHVKMFTAEASSLGYTLADRSRLMELSSSTFFSFRKEVLDILGELADIPNVRVLFNKFPYDTPDQFEYLIRRIVGFLRQNNPNVKGRVLSCGHVIDNTVFPNLDDFGVCPICQFEVNELDSHDTSNMPLENVSPLKVLHLIEESDVQELAEKTLARQSSLSKQEKDFLALVMAQNKSLALPEKCYKETLPFIYFHYKNVDYVKSQLSGATDVLRLATYVSDQDADLSLSENTKFKFSERDRKNFLSMLDGLSNLEEDFMRHRGRWIRMGEKLHPMAEKNARKYPNVAQAFETLRNNPKSIETFNRSVERNVADVTVLSKILAKRPGEFARRLDMLIRNSTEKEFKAVLVQLEKIVSQIRSSILFEISSYLSYRREYQGEKRVFFIKGANKYWFRDENRPMQDGTRVGIVLKIIDAALTEKLKLENQTLGKVYIDPALAGRVIPFNRRGDSVKSENLLEKGSRYPFKGDVIRLFVWWEGHIDVDLSANFYDENWNYTSHVAFTNLKNGYAVHSGDIQNAPNGATEFVDIDIGQALAANRGARYVVSSIISYRGEHFDTFPCQAGFMERDGMTSGRKFEPQSVATKVDINSKSTSQVLFAFDLITREVILIDMQQGRNRYGYAHGQSSKFQTLAKSITDLTKRKPTFYDVLTIYADANGKITDKPEEADVVFNYDMDVQKIYDLLE